MPEDARLWMTFPIDFWMHPKIRPLSDAALRTFVEINGYSRMNDLDGRVPVAAARATWKVKALTELTNNHPERPSLSIEGDDYVIWNYDQHQETKASRAKRQETNRANGVKGGRPPKGKRTETQSVTGSVSEPEANENQSQSSELRELQTDDGDTRPRLTEVDAGEADESEFIAEQARQVGIRNILRIRTAVERVTGPVADPVLIDLTRRICDLATSHVKSVEAYVETTCLNSPGEVQDQLAQIPTPEAVA